MEGLYVSQKLYSDRPHLYPGEFVASELDGHEMSVVFSFPLYGYD